jgi:DNA replication initiation complex subunit (GINS family)
MDIRERKIVSFALSFVRSGSFPASMLPEEKELFEGIAAMIKEHQGRREMAMNGERPALKAVAFLQDIPQFVGIDMGCYGPYSKGDIASVPEANAKVLVEKGAAELAESGS